MAVAPVVSRWMQSRHHAEMAMPMMDHAAAMPAMDASAGEHSGHHGMSAEEHALHMAGGDVAKQKPSAPADPHAAHGEACDYCTMASRLLPLLALLLVLAPLLYRLAPPVPRTQYVPACLRWPAHPARGPPQLS